MGKLYTTSIKDTNVSLTQLCHTEFLNESFEVCAACHCWLPQNRRVGFAIYNNNSLQLALLHPRIFCIVTQITKINGQTPAVFFSDPNSYNNLYQYYDLNKTLCWCGVCKEHSRLTSEVQAHQLLIYPCENCLN